MNVRFITGTRKVNRYSIEKMLAHFESGENIEFLFFWGHTSSSMSALGKQCLSQWFDQGFTFEDVYYKTAEHWMMAQKARLFRDDFSLQQILESDSPAKAKALGKKVKNFGPDIWNENKYRIVVEGNIHKFTQNNELFRYLKSTGSKYIVEASPDDCIWGIGIAESSEDIDNPYAWEGENLLGFALMEVRDRIKGMEYFRPLEKPMQPPWIKYPDIEFGDLFWRMGDGEDYLMKYHNWYESLSYTDKVIFDITYPPKNGWERFFE